MGPTHATSSQSIIEERILNHPKNAIDPFFYLGAAFNLIIAWQYFRLWSSPGPDDGELIVSFATLMAFEFVMVHSGVFMAVFPRKWSLLVFFPFYGLFALAFSASMPNNLILWVYLIAVAGRMRFAFQDVPIGERVRLIIRSAIAAFFYLILTFAVAIGAPIVPELGLTQEFLNSIGYFDISDTGGLFIDEPKTALSLGVFYFIAITVMEWFVARIKTGALQGMVPT